MAVMAVLREGFETSVFLLAAFNASASPDGRRARRRAGGRHRDRRRLRHLPRRRPPDLARFFKFTGWSSSSSPAGLVATALHTAHEAGWIDFGQTPLVDLSWLATPGTIQAALLTGVLGIQPHPTVIETVGYFLYLIPMLLYVLWPPQRRSSAPVGAAPTAPSASAPSSVPSPSPATGSDR